MLFPSPTDSRSWCLSGVFMAVPCSYNTYTDDLTELSELFLMLHERIVLIHAHGLA